MAPRSTMLAGLPWRCVLTVSFIISFLSRPTSAANSVHIVNKCPYNLYFWVVGPRDPDDDERFNIVPPGNTVIHQMFAMSPERNGGTTLKIRDLPHYEVSPSGIIQVEYNLVPENNHIIWDLSSIDCQLGVGTSDPRHCPFFEGGIKLYTNGQGPNEKSASCLGEECFQAYTKHGSWPGEPSWGTALGNDVFFETCTHSAGSQTIDTPDHDYVPAAPPPPDSPPLPPPPPPPPSPLPTCPDTKTLYPTPPGFPPNTLCLNEDCSCSCSR